MNRLCNRSGRWQIFTGLVLAAAMLSSCSSSTEGSASGDAPAASYPKASDKEIAAAAAQAMNPGIDVAKLPPEIKTAFASGATPLTADQEKIWKRCIGEATCETGQGTKTVAVIDDLQSPYYSLAFGEFLAQAIQSGQVSKIVHTSTNGDVTQFLSSFRQAIAQRVDLIFSEMAVLGDQAGPVLAQAQAANIPVVNGATPLKPDLAKMLGVELLADPCDMWAREASTLTEHLKEKGVTDPTFAMFSGPAGNAYAASWQPCAAEELSKLGWTKVYTGYDTWTPQGQTQAASALLASGKDPDVILNDDNPTQFIESYVSAGEKLPLIMTSGSVQVATLNAYKKAEEAGAKPDLWAMSSQPVMWRFALVAGLEAANGEDPSSNPIVYPLGAVPLSEVVKTADLNVDSSANAGSLLDPALQNEALQH